MNHLYSSLIVATALANLEVDTTVPARDLKGCNEIQEEVLKRIETLKGYVPEDKDKIIAQCHEGGLFMRDPMMDNMFLINNDGSSYICELTGPKNLNCSGPLTNKETIEFFRSIYKTIEM